MKQMPDSNLLQSNLLSSEFTRTMVNGNGTGACSGDVYPRYLIDERRSIPDRPVFEHDQESWMSDMDNENVEQVR